MRYHDNTDYFDDPYQGIPLLGYGKIFEKMLTHPKIHVHLNTDFFDVRHLIPKDALLIYTGVPSIISLITSMANSLGATWILKWK